MDHRLSYTEAWKRTVEVQCPVATTVNGVPNTIVGCNVGRFFLGRRRVSFRKCPSPIRSNIAFLKLNLFFAGDGGLANIE